MDPLVKQIGDWVVWAVGVGTALVVIFRLIVRPITQPLNDLKTQMEEHKKDLKAINSDVKSLKETTEKKLSILENDTGDLLCDRLSQSHEMWVKRKYCPHSEKERLTKMYRRYHAMGRNHLSSSYEQDIIGLPEDPPAPTSRLNGAVQQ